MPQKRRFLPETDIPSVKSADQGIRIESAVLTASVLLRVIYVGLFSNRRIVSGTKTCRASQFSAGEWEQRPPSIKTDSILVDPFKGWVDPAERDIRQKFSRWV